MTVSKFRITAGHLQARVRSAAKDSSKVVFVPAPQKRGMAGMMLFHQVMCCLREGEIVGKPKLAENGLWEFTMERFAANQWFSVRVAAEVKGAAIARLYAILKEE